MGDKATTYVVMQETEIGVWTVAGTATTRDPDAAIEQVGNGEWSVGKAAGDEATFFAFPSRAFKPARFRLFLSGELTRDDAENGLPSPERPHLIVSNDEEEDG